MEKPNVTQLELDFSDNKEGVPVTTVPSTDDKEKEKPTLLMTVEEKELINEENEGLEYWQK